MIDDKLLEQAIQQWGVEAQTEMIQEECIELALAIQKLKRRRGDNMQKLEAVIDEIADVKIMIKQAEKIFDKEAIDKRVVFKMNRLKERLLEGIS